MSAKLKWFRSATLLIAVLGALLASLAGGAARASSTSGAAGQMPAYFNGQLFTINLKQEPGTAEQALLAHNGSVNTIYMSGQFIDVIDEIQGKGFNPLWQEVDFVFNPGHQPHQFTSAAAIVAAANAGEITLSPTQEVYRCSVVGRK